MTSTAKETIRELELWKSFFLFVCLFCSGAPGIEAFVFRRLSARIEKLSHDSRKADTQ